jgi:hypothetical protein
MDWLARTYVKWMGKQYRIKVFEKTVWVERQPDGTNLPFDRVDHPVWNFGIWNEPAMMALINTYEHEGAKI